ncbi:MAG: adenosylcobinamide-GDP ribazoletransferase [Chlorobiaceae bacterium]|jgi:adenosylcobinamide-GDP ribazoletransferase|nr:adenosylcobinamide-GDP ribazoletransferase [Chlorobiaceae bacterium]NTW73791.1 adenosylcobinamide-GDP ribazoletransferase [Chlorobiaceae bacterium]
MLAGLVTALRTLTILPVPGRDAERFSSSLYWFTFTGLLIGLVETGLAMLGMAAGWPELAAFLAVAGGVLLTGGLHADGLADLADGFFGGRTRESSLRIMKDPNVGSFGAIALVLLFLFKWIALQRLLHIGSYGPIASGVVLARMAQVVLAERLPYARPGSGTAKAFVDGAGLTHLLTAAVSASLLVLLLMRFDPLDTLILVVAALGSAGALGLLAMKKIGGVTGDVLGAVSEMTELFVWVSGALFFGR